MTILSQNIKNRYFKLRHFLVTKQWQKADLQTRKLMLEIVEANQRTDILLTEADITNFPCKHLQTIDKLWVECSQGKYGFSVIYQIYLEENRDYFKLAKRTGWCIEDQWINHDNIDFTDDANKGHLPLTWLIPKTFDIFWSARFASAGWRRILDRLEKCNLLGK